MKRLLYSIASLLLLVPFLVSSPAETTHLELGKHYALNSLSAGQAAGSFYEDETHFTSEIQKTEHPFQLLSIEWEENVPTETLAEIELRTKSVKGTWNEWQHIHKDEDGYGEGNWSYLLTENSDAFQYRIELSTENPQKTPTLSNLKIDYVNGGNPSLIVQLGRQVFSKNKDVVSRKEWGANEALRLESGFKNVSASFNPESDQGVEYPDMELEYVIYNDNQGKPLWWPQEYAKDIKKIIIHHTATTGNLNDPEVAIRAIYQYHTITRKWGDIGYNYIIAPDGSVFEGRAGGKKVVGAHAAKYNTGSVGIALLGNYQDEPLPGPMVQSLMALVADLSEEYDLDPEASGTFRGKKMLNVLGHRDVSATACPGEVTYDYLPQLRQVISDVIDDQRQVSASADFAFKESGDSEMIILGPKEKEKVEIKIQNIGKQTWTKDTYLKIKAIDGADTIADVNQDSRGAIATLTQTSVAAGREGTFSFTIQADSKPGLGLFEVTPVFNGKTTSTQVIDVTVYQELGILDFSVDKSTAPKELKGGTSKSVTLTLKNTGNITWSNKVVLELTDSSGLTNQRPLATLTEASVEPGKKGTFTFNITAPSKGGTQSLKVRLSMKDPLVHSRSTASFSVKVKSTSGSTSTRSSQSSSGTLVDYSPVTNFAPGESRSLWMQLQNNSTSDWAGSQIEIGTNKISGLSVSKVSTSVKTIKSQMGAKVYFTLTAPTKEGTYSVELLPKIGTKKLIQDPLSVKLIVGGEAAAVSSITYDDAIRIKLTPDKPIDAPTLTSKSKLTLFEGTTSIASFAANTPIKVTSVDSGWVVSAGSKKNTLTGIPRFTPAEGAEGVITITNMEQRPAWNTQLNDNQFRGTIEFQKVDGALTIINELPIESYLKGIGEVSNGDPVEKIRTIIVLARSYATFYITVAEKFPGKPYDLDDSPEVSQKYLGYGFELRSKDIAKAVEDTSGLVVTYKGKLVKTPYFSTTNGTKTKSAKDVWGWTDTPYLVPVSDAHCKATAFAGHGVGLSGCGATALANQGKSFKEIIKYYYTGVEIEDL